MFGSIKQYWFYTFKKQFKIIRFKNTIVNNK